MAINRLPSKSAVASWLVRVLIITWALTHLAPIQAQEIKDKWKRVFTGDDSIIELNVSSPRFQPGSVMRVEFRTTFSKPERLSSTSDLRYKSRLETIDFKLKERRYRLFETMVMNEAGKALSSYQASTTDDWRVIKQGGVMERLFDAVRALPPFGIWKVISYRFAEGGSTPGTPELDRLVGAQVRLTPDQAAVGTKVCSLPAYEHKSATKEDLARELGVQSIAIDGNAESIAVRCSGSGWTPPTSLLIKGSGDQMLMLWDGVFLVLKRAENGGSIDLSPKTLKRRVPPG